MTTGSGLEWATFEELVDTGGTIGEYFGNPGDWITHATMQSALDNKYAAKIMCGGFEHIALKFLQKNVAGTTGASNGAEVWIWGVVGFGEPYSNRWNNNNLLAIRLGGFNYTRGNAITVSTITTIAGPDGETLAGIQSDHGASTNAFGDGTGNAHAIFCALHDMRTLGSGTPDLEQMRIIGNSQGNGGIIQLGGIGTFDALLLTMEKQGHSTVDVNAAYTRF